MGSLQNHHRVVGFIVYLFSVGISAGDRGQILDKGEPIIERASIR